MLIEKFDSKKEIFIHFDGNDVIIFFCYFNLLFLGNIRLIQTSLKMKKNQSFMPIKKVGDEKKERKHECVSTLCKKPIACTYMCACVAIKL